MSYLDQRLNNLRTGTQSNYSQLSRANPQMAGVPSPSYRPQPHIQRAVISPPRMNFTLDNTPMNDYPNLPNLQKYGGAPSYKMNSNLRDVMKPREPMSHNPYGDNTMRDVHSKIHRDIDDRLKLNTEKREIELLIEAEMEKQKLMNSRFDDHQRRLKDEIFELESRYDELDTKVEQKRKLKSELTNKIRDLGDETGKIDQENQKLKAELIRLKELTNRKIQELQIKLNENLHQLESEKGKNKSEAEAKKQQNIQKLERLDHEYGKKLEEWNNKLMHSENEKRKYAAELEFLKQKLTQLEDEANSKLKEIEERVREEQDQKNKIQLKTMQQKLKSAQQTRDEYTRKGELLQKELDNLEKFANNELEPVEMKVKEMKTQIEDQKVQIEVNQKQINELKAEIGEIDHQISRVNETAIGLRAELQKTEEQHNRNVREEMERFNRNKQETEHAIHAAKREVEQREYDLKKSEEEYNRLNKEYQRMVTQLQSNLSKTISNTLVDYKNTRPGRNPF